MPKALKVTSGGSDSSIETSLQRRKAIVIGRSADCDVVIRDSKASRRHCRLTRGETAFVLQDLDSKNGTYVDGQRIRGPVTLKPNQVFKIGDTVFYLAL